MLPPFNDQGDLPPGIYLSSMEEIANRLGTGSDARRRLLAKLRYLLELAQRTGKLSRLLIFGSFVSNTESPRDIDIVLFMQGDLDSKTPRASVRRSSRTQTPKHVSEQAFSGCEMVCCRKR